MFNKAKRLLAILLALVLVFSLVGCGSEETTSTVVIEEIVWEDAETGDDESDNITSDDGAETTSDPDGDEVTESQPDDDDDDDDDKNKVDPEKYRGKTIIFAATIAPENDESGPVVKNFEKEYGIKVDVRQSDQSNYANQLNGWIAAGDSPDVARSNGDFPNCMSYLQSLDAAKLDYDDEIWNQKTFELTTFGGSPYLCDTVGNIWAEIDIVVYSKSLLKRANCYTPEEYDKMGKWTWDAYFEICRAVSKIDGVEGGGFLSRENAMHALGGTFYKLENGKMLSGIDNKTTEAITTYCEAWQEGIIGWSGTNGVAKGTTGIATTHAWSTKKTGNFKDANWDDLGFYFNPRNSADSDYACTGMLRGWGICRGAKQPVASGIFLREYLDVNNYDVSNTFISEEAETFFFKVTSIDYDEWNPYLTYLNYNEANAGFDYSDVVWDIFSNTPDQVGSRMLAIKDAVEKGAKNLNNYITKNTGLR